MKFKHSCYLRNAVMTIMLSTSISLLAATNKALDYSGDYLCKGSNEVVGDYEVSVTLKKSYRHSVGGIGIYELVTETENNEYYTGHAVTNDNHIALTFKLSSAKHAEFSTGIGQFKKMSLGKWSFKNNYYEPDDTGGNYGHEYCVMKMINVKKPIKKTESSLKQR